MKRLSGLWRELRRAAGWHRRLLAAGLGAAAVATGLSALAPSAPRTVAVVVATHDLAGGARLARADLRTVEFLPSTVPSSAMRAGDAVLGRVLAAPLRAGVPLTDVALMGRRLVAGYGREVVAAPVRIGDAGEVSLLRVGDIVDVLAASPDGKAAASVVASAVPVVAIPAPDSSPLSTGALLVLAVSPGDASDLAQAAVSDQLSLVLRG